MIYEIILSTKERIEIDAEDLAKLVENAGNNRLIKLKQAIINPFYILAIKERAAPSKGGVEGYIDPESRKFVITARTEAAPIRDIFNHDKKIT